MRRDMGEHEMPGTGIPGDLACLPRGQMMRVRGCTRVALIARLAQEQVRFLGQPHPLPIGTGVGRVTQAPMVRLPSGGESGY